MTDQVQTHSSNGAGADIDAVETTEWLEALDAVVAHDGPDRARQLLTRVIERAQHSGTGPIASLNTPYVNTIPPDREAQLPGDPALERRLRSIVRWNAIAMVVRANKDVLRARRPHRHLPVAGDALRGRLQPLLARAQRASTAATSSTSRATRRPGIYARAFLEGRLTEEQLDGFRQEVSAAAAWPPTRTRG